MSSNKLDRLRRRFLHDQGLKLPDVVEDLAAAVSAANSDHAAAYRAYLAAHAAYVEALAAYRAAAERVRAARAAAAAHAAQVTT